MTSSVYDTLGLVTPVVLMAKKLLQDLCKQKIGWDNPVSDEDVERWEKWKSQLPSLSRISQERQINPSYFGYLKFGVASYLRMVDVEDAVGCI